MPYTITRTVDPEVFVTSTQDVKEWLRLDGTSDDALIAALIDSATASVEAFLRRALLTQTRVLATDGFPGSDFLAGPSEYTSHAWHTAKGVGGIVLPYATPVQSVSSVKYLDSDGTDTTLAASKYRVDSTSIPAVIVPAVDESWPTGVLNEPGSVRVTYVCGYGDDPGSVPIAIRQAVRMTAGALYERECSDESCIPETARNLLRPFRIITP